MKQPSRPIIIVKWLICSIILTGIGINSSVAQKFSLGLKGGPLYGASSYGKRVNNSDYDPKFKFGLYAAGLISFPLKNHYAAVIEGGVSRKTREVLFADGFNRNTSHNNYFDGVLLLRRSFKFNLAENIPGDWFVNLGPHISYWISGKGTVGTADGDGSPFKIVFIDSFNVDVHNSFAEMYLEKANRWLFGLDIGVGVEAPITSHSRLLTEFRFTWGHTFYGGNDSRAWYSWVDFTDDLRANERIISVTVSYIWDVDLQARKKGRSTKDKEVNRKPVKKRKR